MRRAGWQPALWPQREACDSLSEVAGCCVVAGRSAGLAMSFRGREAAVLGLFRLRALLGPLT